MKDRWQPSILVGENVDMRRRTLLLPTTWRIGAILVVADGRLWVRQLLLDYCSQRTEYYWMCALCLGLMRVAVDGGKAQLVQLMVVQRLSHRETFRQVLSFVSHKWVTRS